ncbi:MAG: CDP-glycerol glycerophosphotransferase family protein [Clostridia bacterium]|nr:CDP-glycerol glycerophosphotransferase family protein [Clostridia bacterium]
MMKKIAGFAADVVYRAIKKLPLSNTIIFESHPELSDNTYNVYRFLVDRRQIDKKMKLVWLVEDDKKVDFREYLPNTTFLNYYQNCVSAADRLKYHYYINTAKCIVFCNRNIGKHRSGQFSLCLQHGMPLKASNGGYCIHDNCDKCLCVSEFFADNYHTDFDISYEKMFFCPFPRTDDLFTERDVRSELGFSSYEKVFVWLPTYRKSTVKAMEGFNLEGSGTGIPSMNTVEELKKVDAWLRQNRCVILFKPHPAQPIDRAVASELTNFVMIDNAWLRDKGVRLYELLGKTDALITDYSSVYYDYLLTDKPIGLTVDDIDDYIRIRGFVYDDPFSVLKGARITDNDGLIAFLSDVLAENDIYARERGSIKEEIYKNAALIGHATEYVSDMILDALRKKRGSGGDGTGDGV